MTRTLATQLFLTVYLLYKGNPRYSEGALTNTCYLKAVQVHVYRGTCTRYYRSHVRKDTSTLVLLVGRGPDRRICFFFSGRLWAGTYRVLPRYSKFTKFFVYWAHYSQCLLFCTSGQSGRQTSQNLTYWKLSTKRIS